PRGVRGRIKFNRVEQVARRLSVQSSQLAIQGNMASIPNLAHRMGDLGHLLFQSTGVRNFDYRSVDDFTVCWEEREVQLSHLTGIDFFVSYWSENLVGHTFLSFIFDNALPLSISIETRPVIGQGFNPVASLFRQFGLIYAVGDERDLVRVRTNFRKERVYL